MTVSARQIFGTLAVTTYVIVGVYFHWLGFTKGWGYDNHLPLGLCGVFYWAPAIMLSVLGVLFLCEENPKFTIKWPRKKCAKIPKARIVK